MGGIKQNTKKAKKKKGKGNLKYFSVRTIFSPRSCFICANES
jgi:hypothetical protein